MQKLCKNCGPQTFHTSTPRWLWKQVARKRLMLAKQRREEVERGANVVVGVGVVVVVVAVKGMADNKVLLEVTLRRRRINKHITKNY
jgi:hypothetical protein